MGKISRTQINSRLEALEAREAGLKPLLPHEIKELEAALELFESSGEITANQYGDFIRRFEQEF